MTLSVDVPTGSLRPVETAAYFTVAEALANAIKHADATRVDIRDPTANGMLVAEVVDDGAAARILRARASPGSASGSRRSTGRCASSSPAGGPTTVRAELPCGS